MKHIDAYNEENAKCLAALLNRTVKRAQSPEEKLSPMRHFQQIMPLAVNAGGIEVTMGNIVASRRRQHVVVSFRGAVAENEFVSSEATPLQRLGQNPSIGLIPAREKSISTYCLH